MTSTKLSLLNFLFIWYKLRQWSCCAGANMYGLFMAMAARQLSEETLTRIAYKQTWISEHEFKITRSLPTTVTILTRRIDRAFVDLDTAGRFQRFQVNECVGLKSMDGAAWRNYISCRDMHWTYIQFRYVNHSLIRCHICFSSGICLTSLLIDTWKRPLYHKLPMRRCEKRHVKYRAFNMLHGRRRCLFMMSLCIKCM